MSRQLLSIAAVTLSLCLFSTTSFAGSGDSGGKINITINKELLSKNVRIEHRKSDLIFAAVRNAAGADSIFYCESGEVSAAEKQKTARKTDFLWFKQAGKAYLIQDPALLAKANDALKDVDQYSAQMTQLGLEMGGQGASMGALGIKMAAAVFMTDSEKKMDAVGKQMDDMGKQMEALGKKMEILNKQKEDAANSAEPTIRKLIQDALASGKANPV